MNYRAGIPGKIQADLLKTEIVESLPYFKGEVTPLYVRMPETPGLYHLTLRLRDENAYIYHLNFTSFLVEERDQSVYDRPVKPDKLPLIRTLSRKAPGPKASGIF